MRRSLAIATALLVALAGCGGFSPGGTNDTAPGASNGTTPGGTTTESGYAVEPVVAATEAVDTYRVEATVNRTQSSNGVTRNASVESVLAANRTAMELRANQTTQSVLGTATVRQYFLNGTLYQYSSRLAARGGSGWRKQAVDNASEAWERLDTLHRQAVLLEHANVSTEGDATVDGIAATRLDVDVNETAYEEMTDSANATATTGISNADFEMWVANDTHRLLRSEGVLNTTAVARGQTVRVNQTLIFEFTYGDPVSVSLPKAAADAPNASA